MKKILALTLIILTMCLLFTACKCEHQYEETVTKEASCSAVGIKTFTCKECNESYTEEIPMLEHTYTSAVTKEPTCAEKGTTTFTCAACNESYTEEIEMVAHTWGEAAVTKEATCIAEGEKTATCMVCGETKISEKLATVEHTYQKAKVKVAATCTTTGVNILTCSVCNDSKEETTKALGHNHEQSKVITQVTCTSDGEITMSCVRCGDSYNKTKKATGHNWIDATCTRAKCCTNCNLKEGDALGHAMQNGSCSRCGEQIVSFKMGAGLPQVLETERSFSGNATIVEVSGMEYSVTENADGTVNVKIVFTVCITKSNGGDNYTAFWVQVQGLEKEIAGFKGYVGQVRTAAVEYKNVSPGAYKVWLSP